MKIKPLGEKIVVQRLEADSKTPGGIVLPDSAQKKPQRGIVKAVGTGKQLDNGGWAQMQTKVNDEILFTAYAGNEVKINDDEFIIMNESDVLAILE